MEYTITYGRSVVTIAEQLFGKNEEMTQEEKVAGAQKIYDAVLNAFPQLRSFMISAQKMASEKGYVETILGRRRHIPDMMLPEFEFVPMKGYVNPDIDPLDINTLQNKNAIPERIVEQLKQEFKGYKYFGQIVKRIRELSEEGIKVINNRPKITEASRQCVNCVDYETEILTADGWKNGHDIKEGDEIISYDTSTDDYVHDIILKIHRSNDPVDMVSISTPFISALTTYNHRWYIYGDPDRFVCTSDIVAAPHLIYHVPIVIKGDKYYCTSHIRNQPTPVIHVIKDYFDGVWCVTTRTGTWIARRHGTMYITGNSVVQGSAAEMTKMAILSLEHNEDWRRIGGRLLTPVHDELIAEVPMDSWEEGGQILSDMMCKAGDFLPFPIKCDVETMIRWYGMEFPCPYPMPEGKSIDDIDSFSEDEIKWVQYHLVEMEYILPTYKDAEGNKPIGDAAHGVNGVISDEMRSFIYDYIGKYRIAPKDFVEHIHNKVYYGI